VVALRFLILALTVPLAAQSACDGHPVVTFAGWRGDTAALVDGFCVRDEAGAFYWQEGLPDANTHNSLPVHFETRAIWQSGGVIEATAAMNGVDLAGYAGAVALNPCAWVGSSVYVRPNATEAWMRVVVADCVRREHLEYHAVAVESGIELGWELAQQLGVTTHVNEWGGVGMYDFEVCAGIPEMDCAGTPVNYTAWYLDTVRYE
jgi:hypothetical protein